MLHPQESLLIHSIEDFLSPTELKEIAQRMDSVVAAQGKDNLDRSRRTSVHAVDGLTTDSLMKLYEPAGRVELKDLPPDVIAILDAASDRAVPHLKRLFPSGGRLRSWIYLEYSSGQHITPHIDMAVDGTEPSGFKVAGIGVPLNDDYVGGEFYVETCGSESLWSSNDDKGVIQVREGADSTSDWYPELKRTQWVVRPAAGTAVLYGSQLTHGTKPIISGTIKKIIGFFTN
jgi:hypothetical protein